MSDRLWVAWNTQRRNNTLSAILEAEMVEFRSEASNWIRYPSLSIKTLRLIKNRKPDLLFVQNPSLILTLLAGFAARLAHIPLIVDAHNAGIFPLEGRSRLINKIALSINSFSDIVIVSNDGLKRYFESHGVKAFTLPDPLPSLAPLDSTAIDKSTFDVVYVCSWAADEPYEEVIRAVDSLDESFRVYITGKPKKHISSNLTDRNVTLTGYLSEPEYASLLCQCDAVMILTDREDCLVCGAYEGMSLEKPLILSDTKALRAYFSKGSIYTKNTPDEIARAIHRAMDEQDRLGKEISELKQAREKEFSELVVDLNRYIDSLVNNR